MLREKFVVITRELLITETSAFGLIPYDNNRLGSRYYYSRSSWMVNTTVQKTTPYCSVTYEMDA